VRLGLDGAPAMTTTAKASHRTTCRTCGTLLTQPHIGRPRLFCGAACKCTWHMTSGALFRLQPPHGAPLRPASVETRRSALIVALRALVPWLYDVANLPAGHGAQISMDGRGRGLDNVFIERLWRSVKHEEVYLKAYENLAETRRELGAYFDFYNSPPPAPGPQRPHAR